jgi:hypothetical protein
MARSARSLEIDGEGAFWAVAGFVASLVVGLASSLSAALPEGDLVVAQAGQLDAQLDLDRLPHLDEEGRIPAGHRRSVGGTLVLPAEGAVVDLVRRDRRVGSLVIVPAEDRPILRTTRLGIAATAHALANAR